MAEYSDDDSNTTLTVYTDSDGYATAYFFAPDDPGVTITVSATVETATSSASTSFVANTDADSDHDGVPDVDDGWYLAPQLTTPPAPEANYIILDLGEGVPHGMNNLNEVVGERIGGADYMHEAFLFKLDQAPTSLGFLTDDPTVPNIHKKSIAYAINDDGVITGESTYSWDPNVSGDYPDPPIYPILNTYNDGTGYSRDNYDTHAFRWSNGVMADAKDLSWSLPPSSDHPDVSNKGTSLGWAINNSGTIVGTSDYDVETGGGGWYWLILTQGPHAASFPGGTDPVDINMSTYYSEAYGINEFGATVGYCSGDETVDDRAFLLDGNTLEFLGEPRSGAYGIAINNWYHAIGDFGVGGYNSLYADDSLHIPPMGSPARRGYEGRRSPTRQVTMDNGTPADHVVDLEAMADEQGYYGSLAVAINDSDQIVGNSNGIPVVWQNSSVRRLQDLISGTTDWQLWDVAAINQGGTIAVGGYKTTDYTGHALLLVPLEFVEVTPALKDESGIDIPNSTQPVLLPASNELVKEGPEGEIPDVAYRILKVKLPKGLMGGKTVLWTLTPQYTPDGESEPRFRGVWPQEHPDEFEANTDTGYDFERVSQSEARTTVDQDGYTAVRINLPPIGFNRARVNLTVEQYPGTSAQIDFEVPAAVVIDPGHGGTTDLPGSSHNNAVSASGVLEKTMCLAYGLTLRSAIRSAAKDEEVKVKVFMTRETDINVSGADRAAKARDNGADVIFIIHFNDGSPSHTARGTLEVTRDNGNVNQDEDGQFINEVIDRVVPAIQSYDSGANKRSPVVVNTAVASDINLGNTTTFHPIRAGYIEVEFIDNPVVDSLLNTGSDAQAVRTSVVEAMQQGIFEDLQTQPTQ